MNGPEQVVPRSARSKRGAAVLGTALAVVVASSTLLTAHGAQARSEAKSIPSGGTVTMPIIGDPTFNPWYPSVGVESVLPDRVIFEGLTRPGAGGLPKPDLATKWNVSKSGLTWTFHLRNGVKWQDGKPFTSADVVYTFNNVALKKSLGASGSGNFLPVKSVSAPNKSTAVFHLNTKFAALPSYLGYNAGILPKHIFAGQDPFKLTSFNKGKPIGTGAFKLSSYVPDQSATLVANPHYWGGKPHLHSIVFKVVADPNAQVAQLLSGEINLENVSVTSLTSKLQSTPGLTLRSVYIPQFFWIALNQKEALFRSVKVRQAMMYAMNRKAMISSILHGYGTIANAAISPALKYYYNSHLPSYSYSPSKAKALLKSAGWKAGSDGILTKNGTPFSFTLDVGQTGYLPSIAQLYQSYMKAVGIDVKLNMMEWNASIQKDFVQKNYQAVVNWWTYPDDPDLTPFFASAAAAAEENEPNYKNAKMDALLKAGSSARTPAARRAAYNKVQAYMAQQLPYLFLWFPKEIQVKSTKLHGLPSLGIRDAMYYTAKWWMAK